MPDIEIQWPDTITPQLIDDLHRIATDISATGEPTGFGRNPRRDDVRMWAGMLMAKIKLGEARLVTGYVDGKMQGLATMVSGARALPGPHSAELSRILTHPDCRGQGLAHAMVRGLVAKAKEQGTETLLLHLRGNNQGGIAFFQGLGFTVGGLLPNVNEFGDDRYDAVTMYIQFDAAPHVRRNGSNPDTHLRTSRKPGLVSYPEDLS